MSCVGTPSSSAVAGVIAKISSPEVSNCSLSSRCPWATLAVSSRSGSSSSAITSSLGACTAISGSGAATGSGAASGSGAEMSSYSSTSS